MGLRPGGMVRKGERATAGEGRGLPPQRNLAVLILGGLNPPRAALLSAMLLLLFVAGEGCSSGAAAGSRGGVVPSLLRSASVIWPAPPPPSPSSSPPLFSPILNVPAEGGSKLHIVGGEASEAEGKAKALKGTTPSPPLGSAALCRKVAVGDRGGRGGAHHSSPPAMTAYEREREREIAEQQIPPSTP